MICPESARNEARLFALAIEQQEKINAAASDYMACLQAKNASLDRLEAMARQFAETKRLLKAHGNTPASVLSDLAACALRHLKPEAVDGEPCDPPATNLN